MTKEERAQKRLEQLHRAFEKKEDFVCKNTWVWCHHRHPENKRIVNVWRKKNGADEFGVKARFVGESWVDLSGRCLHFVVAWREL